MLVIPNPKKENTLYRSEKLLIVDECYCPNGHNLISNNAIFNGYKGIVFMVKRKRQKGRIAISPIYGCKSRVALDIDLVEGDTWEFCCPECKVSFPVYKSCECGGKLTTFFTSKDADIYHSIGICNRVGCGNAGILQGKELLTQSMLMAL